MLKSLLILEPVLNPCLWLSLLSYEMDLLKIITRIKWLLRTRTCNKGRAGPSISCSCHGCLQAPTPTAS